MDKEVSMQRAKELVETMKADLEIVERLSITLKDNQYFSHSLDGQIDVIISRTISANKNLFIIEQELDKYFKEQEASKVSYKENKEIAPIGLTILDAETLATLEKFKDK